MPLPWNEPAPRRSGLPWRQDDDEERFLSWYRDRARRLGLDLNPDAPEHFYDYRAAFRAGAEPDETGHWPSEFKLEGNPRTYLQDEQGWFDTRTGERLPGMPLEEFKRRAREKSGEPAEPSKLALLGSLAKRWGLGGPAETASLVLSSQAGDTMIPVPGTEGPWLASKLFGKAAAQPMADVADQLRAFGARTREQALDTMIEADWPPALAATQQAASDLFGPEELLPGGMLAKAGRAVARAPIKLVGREVATELPELVAKNMPPVAAIERRLNADLRAAVSEKLAGLKGIPDADLLKLQDEAFDQGDEALERAIEREFALRTQGLPHMHEPGELLPTMREGGVLPEPLDQVPAPPSVGGRLGAKAVESEIPAVDLGRPRMTPGPAIKPPDLPGQVNVQKFGLPKASEDALVELIRKEASRLEKAGFGKTITWQQTVEAAENLARRTSRSPEELIARFQSQKGILDAQELTLVNSMVQGTDQQMRELVERMATVTDPTELDRLKTLQDGLAERYVGLLELSIGNSSRAARALQAQRMVTGALDMPNFQRRQLLKQYKPRMTEEARTLLAQMDPEDPAAMGQFFSHLRASNFGDYAWTYWVSSVLSGLGTQARNLFGNASHFAGEAVVRPLRAAVDVPLSKIAGRPREFYFREAVPDGAALVTGLRDGLRKAASVVVNGVNPSDPAKFSARQGMGLNPWLYLRSDNAIADKALKALGVAIDAPFRALGATDAIFRTMAETTEAHRLAVRGALKDGLRAGTPEFAGRVDFLVRNPPEEMVEAIGEFGKRMTFTDEPGAVTKWMMQGQHNLPAPFSTALRLANPFAKVMGRITARGLELSPLGSLKVGKKMWEAAKAGGSARAAFTPEVSDLVARAGIGSAVMMGAVSWATGRREDGLPHLVAWAPRDPTDRDEFYNAMNLKPWSVVVGPPGQATVIPFAALEPVSFPLAMASAWVQRAEETEESIPQARAFEMALGVGRYLSDKSMMQGLSNLLEMMDDSPQAPAKARQFSNRVASGFLPASAMMRDLNHLMGDDAIRDPQTLTDALLANIPGASASVPARLDTLGNEVERSPSGFRSLFTQTPMAYVKVPEFYPADSPPRWSMLSEGDQLVVARIELQRAGMTPGFMERLVVLSDGTKKVLSSEEWRQYQEMAGQEQEDAVRQLLASDDYWSASPEVRAASLRAALYGEGGARARARQRMFGWGTKTR